MNIYFAYQLASALQYLSENHFHHGDVATRNCLFYSDLTIKLTDCAIALPQYRHEYWSNSYGQLIPLRWIAPEVLTVKTSRRRNIDVVLRSSFRITQQFNRIFIHLQ